MLLLPIYENQKDPLKMFLCCGSNEQYGGRDGGHVLLMNMLQQNSKLCSVLFITLLV